jgi:hypothetical protein
MSRAKYWQSYDWSDLVPRLTLFTEGRIRRRIWRGVRSGNIPGGLEPKDIVYQAIEKTMSGQRLWDQEKNTLFQHLVNTIKSDLNHLATNLDNTTTVSANDDGNVVSIISNLSSPEESVIWRSQQSHLIKHIRTIDPCMAKMAEMMLIEDLSGSIELSNKLLISVKEVENLKKRLQRVLTSYKKDAKNGYAI